MSGNTSELGSIAKYVHGGAREACVLGRFGGGDAPAVMIRYGRYSSYRHLYTARAMRCDAVRLEAVLQTSERTEAMVEVSRATRPRDVLGKQCTYDGRQYTVTSCGPSGPA